MKKLMMIAALMLMSIGAFAQVAGQKAIGVYGAYGIDSDYKPFGIGAKFQYGFTENFRGELSGTYFLKKDFVTTWDINANVHYVIPLSEGFNVYPLLGATLLGSKVEILGVSASDSKFGINAGGGIEYFFSPNLKGNAEVKYQYVKDGDWPVIQVGVAYVF